MSNYYDYDCVAAGWFWKVVCCLFGHLETGDIQGSYWNLGTIPGRTYPVRFVACEVCLRVLRKP